MECSMCGDVGFQISLFQCTKCLLRFQHQYCSRAYFENVSDEVCDWCYINIQEVEVGSDSKLTRACEKRMRNSVEYEECLSMTHNGKVKRKLKNCYAYIDRETPKKLNDKATKVIYNDRRVRRRYRLLDEIMC